MFSILPGLLGTVASPLLADYEKALAFIRQAHRGQTRSSGEPYVEHPIAVADILRSLGADEETLTAALLHDTLEDTDTTFADLERTFGANIARLVQGVSKAGVVERESDKRAQSIAFLRTFIGSMGKDVRVALIKLADRVHNMRTIEHLPRHRQLRIAGETEEIYRPLANLIGVRDWLRELSDGCFRVLHPLEWETVLLAKQKAADQLPSLRQWAESLRATCTEEGIPTEGIALSDRQLRSVYHSIRYHGSLPERVEHYYRIILTVDSTEHCYCALGHIHREAIPLRHHMTDYIATPKINGYQGLHTSVITPSGTAARVIIQTQDMAEHGRLGAALCYRQSDHHGTRNAEWMDILLSLQQEERSAIKLYQTVRSEVFGEQCRVFLSGEQSKRVIEIPEGSTVLDLAYYLDPGLAARADTATVNGLPAPLRQILRKGDTAQVRMSAAGDLLRGAQDLRLLRTSFAKMQLLSQLEELAPGEQERRGGAYFRRVLLLLTDPFFGVQWQKAVSERIDPGSGRLCAIGTGRLDPFLYLEETGKAREFLLLAPECFLDRADRPDHTRYVLCTDEQTLREGRVIGLQAGPDIVEIHAPDAFSSLPAKRFSREVIPVAVDTSALNHPYHFALRCSSPPDANPLEDIFRLQHMLRGPAELTRFHDRRFDLRLRAADLSTVAGAYTFLQQSPCICDIIRISP